MDEYVHESYGGEMQLTLEEVLVNRAFVCRVITFFVLGRLRDLSPQSQVWDSAVPGHHDRE
jgi:hypothetical protein